MNVEILKGKKFRAVILDMDGVLVDTEPVHMQAFHMMISDLGQHCTEQFVKSFIGHSVEDNVRSIIETYRLDNQLTLEDGINKREEIYIDLLKRQALSMLEGVSTIFDFCQDKNLVYLQQP